MTYSPGLALSFAGALVLLLGMLFKRDEHLVAELQLYASGFNKELARTHIAERYDHRAGALLLALGFLVQLLEGSVSQTAGPWLPLAVLTASFSLWWLPRRHRIERELEQVSFLVASGWR